MFQFKKPYEKIEFILRRHWLILLSEFLKFGFMIGLGLIVYYLSTLYFQPISNELPQFILIIYILIIWQIFFRALIDYYLDTWIVTDHRVIDIHQTGLFKRDVSELRYSKIQDVTVKVNGFIPTIFNFGDLVIQTAGTVGEFHFQQIPKPNQLRDKILHLHDEYMRQHVNDVEVHETLGENMV